MGTGTFKYSKEQIWEEFNEAKSKDEKASTRKRKKMVEVFTNRCKMLEEHAKAKEDNPKYYEFVDINFANLLKAYQSPDPRDYFYLSVFGKTFAEKEAESELEDLDPIDRAPSVREVKL